MSLLSTLNPSQNILSTNFGSDSVVCIAAHANTQSKMHRFCFNEAFLVNRSKFDLCVVLNGSDSDTVDYIKSISPDFLFVRENFGLDQGAFHFAINNLKPYKTYVLLHYDHWFSDHEWFDKVTTELYTHDVDVLGNLVSPSTFSLPHNYQIVSSVFGYDSLSPEMFPYFLQGCAGFYKGNVIQELLSIGGIPHGKSNNYEIACICERLMSFLLLSKGYRFGQIAPGYENFLFHADHKNTKTF